MANTPLLPVTRSLADVWDDLRLLHEHLVTIHHRDRVSGSYVAGHQAVPVTDHGPFGTGPRIRPCCCGRLFFGPSYLSQLVMLFTVTVVYCWFFYELRWLQENPPLYYQEMSFSTLVLFLLMMVLYVLTTFVCEPGFVPRGTHALPVVADHPNGNWTHRYCHSCLLRHPDRNGERTTHHDSESGMCVKGFDHFCFIMNASIGERNFRCWFAFVVTANVFFVVMSGFSVCMLIPGVLDDYVGNSSSPGVRLFSTFSHTRTHTYIRMNTYQVCLVLRIPTHSVPNKHMTTLYVLSEAWFVCALAVISFAGVHVCCFDGSHCPRLSLSHRNFELHTHTARNHH